MLIRGWSCLRVQGILVIIIIIIIIFLNTPGSINRRVKTKKKIIIIIVIISIIMIIIAYSMNCDIVTCRPICTFLTERDCVKFEYMRSQSVCLSSVCLSVVSVVHPSQRVEIFGNVSTPFCTVAIC